jgi:hypothetical protein
MTPAKRLLIYALFLGSGATALVYQVTWTRNLSLIFGASFEAVSIVLASFMAGQALGGISSRCLRSPCRHCWTRPTVSTSGRRWASERREASSTPSGSRWRSSCCCSPPR